MYLHRKDYLPITIVEKIVGITLSIKVRIQTGVWMDMITNE